MRNFSGLWLSSALFSPMRTPTDVEAMEIVKKLHSVEGRVPAVNDSFSWYSRRNVRNSTMATASFSTLSPNTKLGWVHPFGFLFRVHAFCLTRDGRGDKRTEQKKNRRVGKFRKDFYAFFSQGNMSDLTLPFPFPHFFNRKAVAELRQATCSGETQV